MGGEVTILRVQVEGTIIRQVYIEIDVIDGQFKSSEMRQKAIDQFKKEFGEQDYYSVQGSEVVE
jgi:hypothetical protein